MNHIYVEETEPLFRLTLLDFPSVQLLELPNSNKLKTTITSLPDHDKGPAVLNLDAIES